jgi:hypothetical protein
MSWQQGPGYPQQGPGYPPEGGQTGQPGYRPPAPTPTPAPKSRSRSMLIAIGVIGGLCFLGMLAGGKKNSENSSNSAVSTPQPVQIRQALPPATSPTPRASNTPPPAPVVAPTAPPQPAPVAPAAPATPSPTAERLRFPAEVHRFRRLSELQQEDYASTFSGKILYGSGRIFSVENCGIVDDSARYGSDCIKVLVDTTTGRAALYFASSRRPEISALRVGQRYTFDNCTTISIRNWGFWATATCDMSE